jgi:tetratricopeptide (TPR) repeat protein
MHTLVGSRALVLLAGIAIMVPVGSGQATAQVSPAASTDSARRLESLADSTAKHLTTTNGAQVLHLYGDALTLYRVAGRRLEEVRVLNSIGRVHYTLGRRDSALVHHRRALDVALVTKNRAGEGAALNGIGNVNYVLGRADSALAYYRATLAIRRDIGDRAGEGAALFNIGLAHSNLRRPDSALAYYRQSLAIRREVGDRAAEGQTLLNMGVVHRDVAHPDSALTYYAQALVIVRETGQRASEARVLHNIGIVNSDLGRPDSALAYYGRALAIRRETGDRRGEAEALDNIGGVNNDIGRLDSALTYLRQALAIRRETGDRRGEGRTLQSLGVVTRGLGRSDTAVAYLRLALVISREVGDRVFEAAALDLIGTVNNDLGRRDSALIYLHEALTIRREIQDPWGEGATLDVIGQVNRDLGRPDSALAYLGQSLALRRQTGDRPGEGATLHILGSVNRDLGRPDSALAQLRRALAIHRETRQRQNEGATLDVIGSVFSDLGHPDSALANYRQALAIHREIGHRVNEGVALLNVGNITRDLGRRDSARGYYQVALATLRDAGDRGNEGAALHNLGTLYRQLGHPDSALAHYERALVLYRETRWRANEAMVLADAGGVYLDPRGRVPRDPARAAAYFDSASAVFATIRRHAGGDANAISLTERGDARPLYGNWALAWLARGGELGGSAVARAALAAAERGRAQALLDLLRRRADDVEQAGGTPERVLRRGADLADEADSILAPLRTTHTASLSYLATDDTLLVWLTTPTGEVRVSRTALKRDTVAGLVAALRTTLGAEVARGRMARGRGAAPFEQEASARVRRGLGVAGAKTDGERALRRLATLLVPADLERHLPPSSEIVVVPHGVLGLVPFAALPLGPRRDPLGSRYALRYAPSLAALATVPHEPTATLASRASEAENALVVGDPSMPMVRNATGDSSRLRPLPAAATEGQWVAMRVGTTVLTGVAATETAVRRRLRSASLVHLATHGLAFGSEARVRDSYVALAPDSANDGLLTMGELLDDPSLTLSADLVVLSACQTGLGELKQAEGMVGFQRALLAKGVRSVLVSLWSVDDEATRLLMERFYTHWLGDPDKPRKAEALRRAQDDVRGTKGYEHPRYWAAFQLVGAR